MLSLISGRTSDAWVFALHGMSGAALGLVVGWKLRRVWHRVVAPWRWDRRTIAGLLATLSVGLTLASGWIWSNGGDISVAGFNLLNWHITLGVLLTLAVALHGRVRGKPLRKHDLLRRRHVLHSLALGTGALASWWAQRPATALLGWRGASRRWTGSYEHGSFQGNAFPATSWVADRPRPLAATYHLVVDGLVTTPLSLPLESLHAPDHITATLDCTGGFYSTQHWHGISLRRLLEAAQPLPTATHVRVESHTGYRWYFPVAEADDLLLATAVGDEALAHAHGGPVRLVAVQRRGFQWIKWVTHVELIAGPDYGAIASTIWSSWTPVGRGEA
jgi:hypothetical protein